MNSHDQILKKRRYAPNKKVKDIVWANGRKTRGEERWSLVSTHLCMLMNQMPRVNAVVL